MDIASKALEEARANLENVNASVEKSEFLKAEKRLLDARLAYLMAKDVDNLRKILPMPMRQLANTTALIVEPMKVTWWITRN